jgi:predicted protein tyrosine phosphatase
MPFPKLFVFGQDQAEAVWAHDLANGARITDIVSIRQPTAPVPKGLLEHPARQLRLMIDDVPFSFSAEENLGRAVKACGWDQVRRIVRFSRRVPDDGVVLVHCAAGWSRSPAVALTFLATRMGPGREDEAVAKLTAVAKVATPNPRIVYLADAVLRRSGRLFQAFRDVYWTKDSPYDEWYPPERLGAPT